MAAIIPIQGITPFVAPTGLEGLTPSTGNMTPTKALGGIASDVTKGVPTEDAAGSYDNLLQSALGQ
jgi:hypothetical protein